MLLDTNKWQFYPFVWICVAEGSCPGDDLVFNRAADLDALRVYLRQGNSRAAETPTRSQQVSLLQDTVKTWVFPGQN